MRSSDDQPPTAPPGPIALVGSGEFLPQMADVDRFLLAGRAPRAAFLATAAGLEGPETVSRWLALGAEHYRSLGVEPVPVPVIDGDDADDPDLIGLLDGAGLIYLSGGNPAYLARTLRGRRMWDAIEGAWRAGAALAGCSAGAMALGARVPRIRDLHAPPIAGLGVVPGVEVIPHFDAFERRFPGLIAARAADPAPGVQLLGIDEDTALVTGLGSVIDVPAGTSESSGTPSWTVMGRRSVWLLDPSDATGALRQEFPVGATVLARQVLPPVMPAPW